ncbi:MAG: cupin domain-containing protein [Myxococcota bacterium]|nr:cupin domain-containing protein [Myxococcota bacterium]
MTDNRRSHVVNIDEVSPDEQGQGAFGFRRRRLGPAAGARALGCSHLELPPGKTAFPFHFHSAIEEAIYVLEGTGTLRVGQDKVEVRAGDYVALPPGPDSSHALTNTGGALLRYLCMSGPATPTTRDVVGYPDSKKLAFASGIDPVKGMRAGGWVMKLIKEDQPPVGYYDDEPLAKQ